MWKALLTLLTVLISSLWRMASPQPCPAVADEEDRVQFLLTLLIESRWSALVYKFLYRHRHHRALTSADSAAVARVVLGRGQSSQYVPRGATAPAVKQPPAVKDRATLLNDVKLAEAVQLGTELLAPPPLASEASVPVCPQCSQKMVMRSNRMNHGIFWGCTGYPKCRGSRRLGPHADLLQR